MSDFTMEVRLCDEAGMVSHERVEAGSPGTSFDPDLTYLKLLNNLRRRSAEVRRGGRFDEATEPFACTGSAHLAGEHIRCTSPAHSRSAVSAQGWIVANLPREAAVLAAHGRIIDMRAALSGYDAQYGEQPIGEQHPDLPRGCVERVEAVVSALRVELKREEEAQTQTSYWYVPSAP